MILVRLLCFFGVIAVLTYLVHHAATDPGEVYLRWAGYEVATSGAVLAALVLAAVILVFYSGLFWAWLSYVPQWVSEWRLRRKQQKSYGAMETALDALAAGDAVTVRNMGMQLSHALPEQQIGTYFLAAAADLDPHQPIGLPMLENRAKPAFATLRGRIAQAREDESYEEALRLAQQALSIKPNSPWALEAVFDMSVRSKKHGEALALMPQLRRHNVKGPDDLDAHEIDLRLTLADELGSNSKAALKILDVGLKTFKNNLQLGRAKAQLLAESGNLRSANRTLKVLWQAQPDDAVFGDWLELNKHLPPKKLTQRAEAIVKARAHASQAALARAMVEEHIGRQDKANNHLEKVEQITGQAPALPSSF